VGGSWVVWVVLWEAWCATACWVYAREQVLSAKQRAAYTLLLAAALPLAAGCLPFCDAAHEVQLLLLGR